MSQPKLKTVIEKLFQQADQSWVQIQGLFINEINLIGSTLGLEFVALVKIKRGIVLPYFKVRKAPKALAPEQAELREIYLKRKKDFLTTIGIATDDVGLSSDDITALDKLLALVLPKRTLWKAYKRLESQYEMMIVPVMVYQPSYMAAHYEIRKKKSTAPSMPETKSGI